MTEFYQNTLFKINMLVFVQSLSDPTGVADYSRWDLNGDGYTGGENKARFNLDIDYNDQKASQYTQISKIIYGNKVIFDENELTDKEILCYYAFSELYNPDDRGSLAADLGDFCIPKLTAVLRVAASSSAPDWNGLPAKIELTNLTNTAPNGTIYNPIRFQLFGTGNPNCSSGERGGPVFSSQVESGTAFYAARRTTNVPYSTIQPNNTPCSSFVAFKTILDPVTNEAKIGKIWINGAQRALGSFGGVLANWEYQVRFYGGDPENSYAGKQCQVGVVPNSGIFALGFDADCSYELFFTVR